MRWILILVLVLLAGCAPQRVGVETYETSFADNISVLVGYWDGGLFVMEITNPDRREIRAWLNHRYSTETQQTSQQVLIYDGNERLVRKQYRLNEVQDMVERVTLIILNNQGEILRTEVVK